MKKVTEVLQDAVEEEKRKTEEKIQENAAENN